MGRLGKQQGVGMSADAAGKSACATKTKMCQNKSQDAT
jgi:hypothetical protein